MNAPRDKTLNQLEDTRPPEPAFRSHVTTETHHLRDVPLSQLATEDLRLLVGQEIGLDYLVPLAIERVEMQPLADGDFCPGDLLVALLRLPTAFWQRRRDWHRRVEQVAQPLIARFGSMSQSRQEKLAATSEPLREAYEIFTRAARATG